MQEALPYKTWLPMPRKESLLSLSIGKATSNGNSASSFHYLKSSKAELKDTIKENAVIVFGKRGCCMSHVVKRLLQGLGVNPPVYEVDDEDENEVIKELERINGGGGDDKDRGRVQFPAVFIGGQLFGGLDRIMATHITGELTPILKKAGALWL
ncbi:glutaredoxin-C9-like [Coffea eugenioides]|uniref:Glutaredoxin-C9 n=1 Tax=Coffea arabica TaxID=13443 RepID=A0A6P6XNA3_COFAR|nr:glutaredoxin-C9-like [Coffea arabica]XP_027170561.1 glutaredoxin-C9-like [Coffea eugenioides]